MSRVGRAFQPDKHPLAERETLPPVQPWHYQMLCGLALAVILLIQVQQGLVYWGILAFALGAGAILARMPSTPLWVLLVVTSGQLYSAYYWRAAQSARALQVEDVA